MPVGDKQRLIITLLEEVLNVKAQTNKTFPWLKNKHEQVHFQKYFTTIESIFSILGGDLSGSISKQFRSLKPDCYFAGRYNFLFEFDELQHFTTYKLRALELYPTECRVGFNYDNYLGYCKQFYDQALKKGPKGYRKETKDFPFINGRAAQRAYLDCFRDILPQLHGLNKTIRIAEFDIDLTNGNSKQASRKIERLLIGYGL